MKKITTGVLMGLLLTGCQSTSDITELEVQKPNVLVSQQAYKLMVEELSSGLFEVQILNHHHDAHHFTPTAKDIVDINESNLFVYQSQVQDPWFNSQNKTQGSSLAMLEQANIKDLKVQDPHLWIEPQVAKIAASNIAASLTRLLPESQTELKTNLANFHAKLDAVHTEATQAFANCEHKEVLVSHNAFEFIAAEHGFAIESIHGVDHHHEPSAGHVDELISHHGEGEYLLVDQNEVHDFAEVIKEESHLEILEVDVMESKSDQDYFTRLNTNFYAFKKALHCN